MSESQSELGKNEKPAKNETNNESRSNPGLEEEDMDSDNMNLFSNVWVKIEVHDEEEDQIKCDEPTDLTPQTSTLEEKNMYVPTHSVT